MTRLPCDDLHNYVFGLKHYYPVTEGDYKEDDIVILYNKVDEAEFRIMNVIRYKDKISLGLILEENVKKINSYYGGVNPND